MVHVSRKEHFNAAHKLYNPGWSKEKNLEVFGPCANENWHGHNFELIVTVKPPIVTNKEFIAETDTLLIDVLAQKNYNHTLYVWDKSIPEDRECVQNFPVTEVQFF